MWTWLGCWKNVRQCAVCHACGGGSADSVWCMRSQGLLSLVIYWWSKSVWLVHVESIKLSEMSYTGCHSRACSRQLQLTVERNAIAFSWSLFSNIFYCNFYIFFVVDKNRQSVANACLLDRNGWKIELAHVVYVRFSIHGICSSLIWKVWRDFQWKPCIS